MLEFSAAGWSLGKRFSVLSSLLHSEYARCPRHKDRSSVAVAQHPAPTLPDLRNTSESPSRVGPNHQPCRSRSLRTRPARGSNQRRRTPRLIGHRRVKPEFRGGPSAQRAFSLGGRLLCWKTRRFSSESQAWRTATRAAPKSPRSLCNLLGADAQCS